jgi:hypothetical protein
MPRWSEAVRLPGGGTAIVCFSGGRWCQCGCRRRATIQCDHPAPAGRSGTCDRWLCRRCAVSVGPNRDHCPDHRQEIPERY